MNSTDIIKNAGLKPTIQRKLVYEAMQDLGHATIDMVIEELRKKACEVAVSTVYRILSSFCQAGILSSIYNNVDGKCYYDITIRDHHHLFSNGEIIDYDDPELTELIRQHMLTKNILLTETDKIQVQIIHSIV
ncbi:MAG: transcriptional repressor [Prevotella sp.]|nr:transcriptional repressor [Prevotella sp.]